MLRLLSKDTATATIYTYRHTLPLHGALPISLIGSDAKQLMRLFGQPRLDIRESAMRKLQFANGRCVLDAYLYLPPQGKEPLVTHVDARTPPGTDVDAASCSAALQAK